MLVVIAIVAVIQARLAQGLPTLLEKADLLHGFDLAWRDAVLLHLHWAGISGRAWLVVDAAMASDKFRVRIGAALAMWCH